MNLNKWIENKSKELVNNKTYKSVNFRDVHPCQVSAIMTKSIFSFLEEEKINMDVEIKEFNRKELYQEIDALEVVFDVVKPRCRKPERLRLYVQPMKQENRKDIIMKCTSCGQECFDEQYPEVVFQNENNCICEECSIDYEELNNGVIQLREDLN